MRKWGMPEEEVQLCLEQIKERQRLKALKQLPQDAPLCTRAEYVRLLRIQTLNNSGINGMKAAALNLGNDYETENYAGYKPPTVDPVLKGVGRATGKTAKAVKRGKTFTKFEHDKE